MSKTIRDMSLQDAHDANVASVADGVKEGMFTQPGANFVNDLSDLVRRHLELNGLTTPDFAVLTKALAPLSVIFQGSLDVHGPEATRRAGSMPSMAYVMEIIETAKAYEDAKQKREGVPGPTKASFEDFIEAGAPPNLYN